MQGQGALRSIAPACLGTASAQAAWAEQLPARPGAVVLDVTCFAEAERLYMLARDTAVQGRPLTALVLPEVLVSG